MSEWLISVGSTVMSLIFSSTIHLCDLFVFIFEGSETIEREEEGKKETERKPIRCNILINHTGFSCDGMKFVVLMASDILIRLRFVCYKRAKTFKFYYFSFRLHNPIAEIQWMSEQ